MPPKLYACPLGIVTRPPAGLVLYFHRAITAQGRLIPDLLKRCLILIVVFESGVGDEILTSHPTKRILELIDELEPDLVF